MKEEKSIRSNHSYILKTHPYTLVVLADIEHKMRNE